MHGLVMVAEERAPAAGDGHSRGGDGGAHEQQREREGGATGAHSVLEGGVDGGLLGVCGVVWGMQCFLMAADGAHRLRLFGGMAEMGGCKWI